MTDKPPANPADHAEDFSRRYAEPLDWYFTIRMQELGLPEDKNGAPGFRPRWKMEGIRMAGTHGREHHQRRLRKCSQFLAHLRQRVE